MSRIRGKNTKPELYLRKELWARGLRYRLKSNLIGKPDIVFPGKHLAIFVDGCFWHGCPEHSQMPKSNQPFWTDKLTKNKLRDQTVNSLLREQGWIVLRFWEHEVKRALPECVDRVVKIYWEISD